MKTRLPVGAINESPDADKNLPYKSQHSPLQGSGQTAAASSCLTDRPAGHGPCHDQIPALDRLELNIAGKTVTVREAAVRILGRMINFVEEEQLNLVAAMVDDSRLQKPDLERAITSWATSRGSKSVKYFIAIIDKISDDSKRRSANDRKPTLPEIVIEDKQEAARFLNWLKERHYKGRVGARGAATVFEAQEITSWYSRFRQDAIKENNGEPVGAHCDVPDSSSPYKGEDRGGIS